MPRSDTLAPKGTNSVRIKTTGFGKLRISVVLGCSYAGYFLKTMVIFKNLKKKPKHDLKFDKNFEVVSKPSGTMDGKFMFHYIKKIILPNCEKNKALLIMDSFKAHKTDEVVKILKDNGINSTFIPSRTTSYLQLIDV